MSGVTGKSSLEPFLYIKYLFCLAQPKYWPLTTNLILGFGDRPFQLNVNTKFQV